MRTRRDPKIQAAAWKEMVLLVELLDHIANVFGKLDPDTGKLVEIAANRLQRLSAFCSVAVSLLNEPKPKTEAATLLLLVALNEKKIPTKKNLGRKKK